MLGIDLLLIAVRRDRAARKRAGTLAESESPVKREKILANPAAWDNEGVQLKRSIDRAATASTTLPRHDSSRGSPCNSVRWACCARSLRARVAGSRHASERPTYSITMKVAEDFKASAIT